MKLNRYPLPATIVLAFTLCLLFPTSPSAQARRIAHRVGGPVVVLGAYYSPVVYDPWYLPSAWYPPLPYGRAYAEDASLRIQVSPSETEVFIDGYYAGTVDDFDGFFQRLRLEPGEHDIELFLKGHRAIHQQTYLQPGSTFRVRHEMQPLAQGEPEPVRPVAAHPPPRRSDVHEPPGGAGSAAVRSDAGSLAICVQPSDSEVLIDGERWRGPAVDEQLVVQVLPGLHRVEVRRDGYRTFASDVDVRSGDTTTLNVSLSK